MLPRLHPLAQLLLVTLLHQGVAACGGAPASDDAEGEDVGALETYDAKVTHFSPDDAVTLTTYKADARTLAAFRAEIDALKAGRKLSEGYAEIATRLTRRLDDADGTSDFGPLDANDPIRKNLAEEERVAAYLYTTDAVYAPMNAALRDAAQSCKEAAPQPCPSKAFELLRPYKSTIKTVSSALNKLPPHVGTVHRGTDAKYLAEYKEGATVVESAFVSASAGGGVPEDFRSTGTMAIASTRCAMVAMLSDKPFEGEVLCPPGTAFKVNTRTVKTGSTHVEVTQL